MNAPRGRYEVKTTLVTPEELADRINMASSRIPGNERRSTRRTILKLRLHRMQVLVHDRKKEELIHYEGPYFQMENAEDEARLLDKAVRDDIRRREAQEQN